MPIHVTTSTIQSLSNKTFVDYLSTTGVVYADGGNSEQWNSTFSIVQTNSADWNYQGSDIKALTANWENTYTDFSANSGKYESAYTITNTNSASWSSVYTTVNTTSANVATSVVGITIDGAGSAITTGYKGFIQVPYNATITAVTLLADTTGSIVIDIWKDTYANYPPAVADSITGASKPTLTSASKYTDSTLSGWTTTITAGDIVAFNVDSISTITKVSLTLKVIKI